MKNQLDPRHSARVIAVQQLFIKLYGSIENTPSELVENDDLLQLSELDSYQQELFESIIEGVESETEKIDKLIEKLAPQWPVDQIKKVDLTILRIAIYEGFIAKITPPKVAIDEAIELAKEFGGAASDKFVSGVLGALYEGKKKTK